MKKTIRVPQCLLLVAAIGCDKEPAEPAAQQQAAPAPAAATAPATDGDPTFLADLAEVHIKHQKHDSGLALLQRALQKETDSNEQAAIRMRLGEVYDNLGRKEEAKAAYEQAVGKVTDPGRKAKLLLRLGQSYRKTEELEKAAEVLEKLLRAEGSAVVRSSARSELIKAWSKLGVLKDRVKAYEEQLAENPDDIETMRFLGAAYATALSMPDKAIPHYEKLVKADPGQFGLSWQLGNLYYQARQFKEGVAYFTKLAERSPNRRTEAYERIASGYASMGNKAQAVAYARKLGEAATPHTPHVYTQQGRLLGRLGEDEEAVASFKKAIQAAKNDAQRHQFLYDLAGFYSLRKRLEDSQKILTELSGQPISASLRRQVSSMLENVTQQLERSKAAPAQPAPRADQPPS